MSAADVLHLLDSPPRAARLDRSSAASCTAPKSLQCFFLLQPQAQRGVESHIFNTVGSGVKGGGTPGYAVYGATKRGLPQLTDSLVKELEEGVEGYDKEEPVIKAWPNAVERRGVLQPFTKTPPWL